MSESENGVLERQDDFLGVAEKLRQKWDHRLVLGRGDLLERYVAGNLRPYVGFSLGKRGQFMTVFKRHGAMDACECGKRGVVVGVIEHVEDPQAVIVRGANSLVGLKRLDQLSGVAADALYFLVRTGIEYLPLIEDWEFAPTAVVRKSPGPELVCDFSREEADVRRRRADTGILRDITDHDLAVAARVFLFADGIGVEINKRLDAGVELLDMGIGPF